MKYIIRTMLCICCFTALFFPVIATADNTVVTPAIVFEDGSSYPAGLVDKEREAGKLILYTRNYGEFTKPFTEDILEFVIVNDIVVHKSTSRATGTYIPPNGCVVSFSSTDADLVKRMETGREVSINNIDMPVTPDMYFILGDVLVPINQINAVRDANQVILYNPAFGESTKTNIWGIELTVVNSTVTKIARLSNDNAVPSESDSRIPEAGAVISIHMGSPYYKQINESVKTGDTVKISADAKLYNASKISYAAYNPKTLADNPGAWDATKGKPYDGFRGPNQLIIYDSTYGETSGTNPYGYEVTVNSDGIITGTGGNDSSIPEGGYILSGHGDSLKWLETYALLGARLTLNQTKKTAIVILSPDSYINRAALSIKTAKDSLDLAKRQYLDIQYDKAAETVSIAEAKLEVLKAQAAEGKYDGMTNTAVEIQGIADQAFYMTFESMKAENRAVWLRPRDSSIEQIKKRLDMLKELNINMLYLETYWGGYSIYPTTNGLLKQNPMFNGLDILEVYLKEAHARGIEVHAWVENFLVDTPIAAQKPDWMAVSRKGDTWYLENGTTKYHFLNPAHPEVRDFLSGIYKELVKKYNLDGLQFDYMRYSHSGDYTNDFGYDTYTRQLFKSYAGTDPIALMPGDELWEKWCSFRTQLISSYAYRVISEVKSLKPQLKISADVWPEYDKTLTDIYQDPRAWVRNDYIDDLIPMSYYLHEGPVVDDIMNSLEFSRGYSQIISGIASFNKVDAKVLLKQVNAIRNTNTNGIAIFEYESLFNRGYSKVLQPGVFSTGAAVTNRNPSQSIRLLLDDIIRKIDAIYLRNSALTMEQAEKCKELIGGIKTSLTDDMIDARTAYSLKAVIEETITVLVKDELLDKEAANRIIYDLKRSAAIIDGYISGSRFLTGHQVSRLQIEMPISAIEDGSEIPYRVKAVFEDGSVMYPDKSQYLIRSGNPAAVEITDKYIKIKDKNAMSVITIEILDSFSFSTAKGTFRDVVFAVNNMGRTIWDAEYGTLKVTETGFNSAGLDWASTTVDSDITGYIVYRNDSELARTPFSSLTDRNLEPGETYIYYIKGFDIEGNIIYESSRATVKTKALPMVSERRQ